MRKSGLVQKKIQLIAGVDEAGRGPLAGDVVAAAVILPVSHPLEGLTDSKKLTEKKRDILFDAILEVAISWAIARATPVEIDEHNILQASLLAMKRAVDQLAITPDFVEVDGNKLPQWQYPAEAIVQGDSLREHISAASILAKVTRDREMVALDEQYPQYGFAQHKGYPTKRHMQALAEYGASPVHRQSFAPVRRVIENV